jgi:hypothetical protein
MLSGRMIIQGSDAKRHSSKTILLIVVTKAKLKIIKNKISLIFKALKLMCERVRKHGRTEETYNGIVDKAKQ